MDLKAEHLPYVYLVGLALIALGVGFFEWRFVPIVFGSGLVLPILALRSRRGDE